MRHDQFKVRFVRSINAWVAECKDCGWLSEAKAHPLDVDTLSHTEAANAHLYDGLPRSMIHGS